MYQHQRRNSLLSLVTFCIVCVGRRGSLDVRTSVGLAIVPTVDSDLTRFKDRRHICRACPRLQPKLLYERTYHGVRRRPRYCYSLYSKKWRNRALTSDVQKIFRFFYEDLFRNLVQRDTRLYNVAQSALFSLSVPCACRAHVSFNSCRAFSFVRVRFVKVSCG